MSGFLFWEIHKMEGFYVNVSVKEKEDDFVKKNLHDRSGSHNSGRNGGNSSLERQGHHLHESMDPIPSS